jgi:hypothetical protein
MRFLLLFFFSAPAWGAACCGGNSLFPSLISGDERAQVSATTSYSNTVGDAGVGGESAARPTGDFESRSTLKLDVASLVSDRWQLGLSVPVVRRYRGRNGTRVDSIGLGDVNVSVAFEALPQWSYSAWRPKGLVFAGVTAPTGRSPQQSEALYQIDSTGRGYWSVNVGALLQKTWGEWDAILLGEVHQAFDRTVTTDAGDFYLRPAPGFSTAVGIGRSFGDWRFGGLFGASFEGAVTTAGLVDEVGNPQVAFPVTLQASYLFAAGWSLGAFYSDNRLFGARNVALFRTVSVLLQTRWDR